LTPALAETDDPPEFDRVTGDNPRMYEVTVSLRFGPAGGRTVELDAPMAQSAETDVACCVRFGLSESGAGSQSVGSAHLLQPNERRCSQLAQRDTPLLGWVGRVVG
jgi:hypothetical protein